MGKATVVSGGAEGDYVIKLDYGKAQRDAVVKKINKRLDELAPEIDKAQSKCNEQQATEDAKRVAAETAIDDYVEATKALALAFEGVSAAQELVRAIASLTTTTPAELAAAQAALTGAKAAYAAAQQEAKEKLDAQVDAAKELVDEKRKTGPLQLALDLLTSERAQLRKDLSYWGGLQLETTQQAWCTDCTEDATGEVATIEIPGEGALVLIQAGAPGGSAAAGALVAREVQTAEQVFFNAAILPGWQKFKPTYRRGQIMALDVEKNTAQVALYEAKSSAQNLDINRENLLLKDVRVQYMDCHANAFEVNDDCVVMFENQDWEHPLVIGFVSHPRPCRISGIGIQTLDADGAILRVLLQPKGEFGKSTGQWTEKRVEKLHGWNQVWQSSIKPNDYAVANGDAVYRMNAEVAKLNINANVVFSASAANGKKFVVAIRNNSPVDGMKVVFYKGTESLLKLKRDSTPELVQTAQMTLPKWNVIEVHPDGTRFLAWRFAQHESASGRVYATYADKMAWFTVGDGTVTEADDVGIGAGFTVHHADPALPYPGDQPGQVIPTNGSYSYEIVTGAHIASNGEAVVHKNLVESFEVNSPFGQGLDKSRQYKVKINNGEMKDIFYSNESSSVTVNFSGSDLHNTITSHISIANKNLDVLLYIPKNQILLFVEEELKISSSAIFSFDEKEEGSLYTSNAIYASTFSIARTLKIHHKGLVIKELHSPVNNSSYSRSHSYSQSDVNNTRYPTDSDFLSHQGLFGYDTAEAYALDILGSAAAINLVAAAHDPLTGAVIAQVLVDEITHWLVIDDTGVRDISAVSQLIPATSRAQRIVSV